MIRTMDARTPLSTEQIKQVVADIYDRSRGRNVRFYQGTYEGSDFYRELVDALLLLFPEKVTGRHVALLNRYEIEEIFRELDVLRMKS